MDTGQLAMETAVENRVAVKRDEPRRITWLSSEKQQQQTSHCIITLTVSPPSQLDPESTGAN